MNKGILAAFSLVVLMAGSALALSPPGSGILGSVHDMRVSAGAIDWGNNERVCAFCHTPHHAYQDPDPNMYYPLWARQLDTTTFDPYWSPTINASDYYAADIAIGPTRLCMSCHDGAIAPDQHYNIPGERPTLSGDFFGQPGIGSGDYKLLDDHPVGFNYNQVAIGPAAGDPAWAEVNGRKDYEDPWIREAASGNLLYMSNSYSVRVVDRLYRGIYMTCATCHDVHNKFNADSSTATANYLVLAPQKDSQLCRTCHIK